MDNRQALGGITMQRISPILLPILLLVYLCPIAVRSQSCGRQPSIHINGDVIIAGLFNIHEAGTEGQECSNRVNPDALQRLEAYRYAIKSLNENAFIPGVTFGAYAYDTCGQSLTAVRGALDFLARREANQHSLNTGSCKLWPLFLGVIGSMFSSPTEEIASLMTSSHLTQISYGAGLDSLSDREKYPYLLRAIPRGKWRAKVTLDIIRHLGWLDVALVVDEDIFSHDLLEEFLRLAGAADVCIASIVHITRHSSQGMAVARTLNTLHEKGIRGVVLITLPDVSKKLLKSLDMYTGLMFPNLRSCHWISATYMPFKSHFFASVHIARGLISIEEYGGEISGFKKYFLNLDPENDTENPWITQYWEQVHNCSFPHTCTDRHHLQHQKSYEQAGYVSQVVSAVYTYANGLRAAHLDLCGKKEGLCDPLASITPERMTQYLAKASFANLDGQVTSFDDDVEIATVKYVIKNVQMDGVFVKMKNVGIWSREAGLDLDAGFKLYDTNGSGLTKYPESACFVMCACENEMVDNTFGQDEDIDITIAGIFDLHSEGIDAYECDLDLFNENSFQNLEAMHFAIDQINSNPDILPGLKLGSITLDSCRNSKRVLRQVKALLSGELGDKNKMAKPFHAVLGASSSDVSMDLASFLSSYHIPQVSYRSTSTALRNKQKYPYFLRTVSADDGQVRAMVSIIKKFNWQYVTTVFSNNAYGNAAIKEFLRLAEMADICVATQVKLESYFQTNTTSMENIAKFYLLNEKKQSKVIVLFVTDLDAIALLSAVENQMVNKTDNDLIWLASDTWGSREDIVYWNKEIAKGAITMGFYANDIPQFLSHFYKLRPNIDKGNPWITEFWQHHFQCHITNDYKAMYNYSCNAQWSLKTSQIKMSHNVPYVIDGVYAIALGIHQYIKEYCGTVNGTICRKAEKNWPQLYKYVKDMRFYNGITNLTVAFDALGDGIARYAIYNYKKITSNHFEFEQVGHWLKDRLQLDTDEIYAYANKTSGIVDKMAKSVISQCFECTCSSKYMTNLEFQIIYAPLMLVGYFPFHGRSASGVACADFRTMDGFVQYMAFKYAIERINKDPNLLGEVKLGFIALDTCSDRSLATEAFRAYDKGLRLFTQSSQTPEVSHVHAFIGGYDDNVTKALHQANFDGNHLVQLSPGSRGHDLSDQERYRLLLRTSSSDHTDSLVVTRIVKSLGWTYISIVYTSDYLDSIEYLSSVLDDRGACVATSIRINDTQMDYEYEDVLNDLLKMEGAIGVILMAKGNTLRTFLNVASDMKLHGKLIWIIPGGHTMNDLKGIQDPLFLAGSILIVPDMSHDPFFDSYLSRMTPKSDEDNPWLRDFWQHMFECNLEHDGPFTRVCSGRESLNNITFSSNPVVINTINAVYAYAYGLTELLLDKCDEVMVPPCDLVQQYGRRTSALVYHYIKKTKFIGADAKRFSFNEDGSGPGRYKVLNFKVMKENRTSLVNIGEWEGEVLNFNRSLVHMYNSAGERVLPISQCPGTCNCSHRQGKLDKEFVPVEFDAPQTVWGVLVITFTCMGVMFTFVTMLFFTFKYNHPVVIATTCSTSILLLFGILFLFFLNFGFMISPTLATCGIRRLGLGLFHAMIFACLLVKSITVSRVYSKHSLSGKPAFISGTSQTIASLFLISIHLILVVEWMILNPPDVKWVLVNVNEVDYFPIYRVVWRCVHSKGSLVASMWFVYLMMVLTVIFAARGRQAAAFHHEALYIFIAAVCSIVIHFIWILVYLLAEEKYEIPATCIAITVNANLVLGVIFMPKILEITSTNRHHGSKTKRVSLDYSNGSPVYATPNKSQDNNLPMNRLTSFGAVHEQAMQLASKVQNGGYNNHAMDDSSNYSSSKNSTMSSAMDTPVNLATIQANLQSALAARQQLTTVQEDSDSDLGMPPPPPLMPEYLSSSPMSSIYDPHYAQSGARSERNRRVAEQINRGLTLEEITCINTQM